MLNPPSEPQHAAWPVGGSPTHAKRSRHGSLLGHGPLSPRSLQAEQSRQAALARAGGCPRFSLRRLVILVAALAGGSWALCLFCLGVGVFDEAPAGGSVMGALPVGAASLDPYYDLPPPTRPELGAATWNFMHAVATNFPAAGNSTAEQRQAAIQLMHIVGQLFPCQECAEHLRETLVKMPPDAHVESGDDFGQYMCELHNVVNGRLDKRPFNCEKAKERWERAY